MPRPVDACYIAGYQWVWHKETCTSSLICRHCGRPDTDHALTFADEIRRLAKEQP